jgi:hypothetical protein
VTRSFLPLVEHWFYYTGWLAQTRAKFVYAQIAAAAARHVQGWRFTAKEEAAAIAELTRAAAGRADLLGERTGTALGSLLSLTT